MSPCVKYYCEQQTKFWLELEEVTSAPPPPNFNEQILLLLRLILERMKILKEHRFYLDAKVLNLALKHDLS